MPLWRRVLPFLAVAVAVFVIGGHILLWLSEAPREVKLRLTLLNAAGWAVVILPAFGVSLWLKGKTRESERD
ncbi:MAG: phenylalanyl-tRNA synthetase subunit beta [Pseudomonadota bacterium]